MENESKFTINEIKTYILSQDNVESILANLSEDNIRKANHPIEGEGEE